MQRRQGRPELYSARSRQERCSSKAPAWGKPRRLTCSFLAGGAGLRLSQPAQRPSSPRAAPPPGAPNALRGPRALGGAEGRGGAGHRDLLKSLGVCARAGASGRGDIVTRTPADRRAPPESSQSPESPGRGRREGRES